MWKVFPKILLLKVVFLLFAALFLLALIAFSKPGITDNVSAWGKFLSAFKLATPVMFLFLAFVYIAGKWGWKLLWEAPKLGNILNTKVCPDLNGKWVGEIDSNFPDQEGNNTIVQVELDIKADMFGFEITQFSQNGYSNSKVIQCEVFKDPRTNSFYLYYLYEGKVPKPEETDDPIFYGAAKLEVQFNNDSEELEGDYWTNRAWQRRLNTAGRIKLHRES